MSISSNSIITYDDFIAKALSEMKAVCCNIDSFKSDVPEKIRSTYTSTVTRSVTAPGNNGTAGDANGATAITHTWTITGYNKVSVVPLSDISNSNGTGEWDVFLAAAGINTRTDPNLGRKIIQAHDLGLIMGLLEQFLSYHLKPIYSRREAYGEGTVYQGTKYVKGTVTPKYTINGIDPSDIPEVTNSNITDMINKGFTTSELIKRNSNPLDHYTRLS